MVLYYCRLKLHDNVFFATREMGILYETEKYLHNWALTYAIFAGSYLPHPYHSFPAQQPGYLDPKNEQNLFFLNPKKIYVFPALPLRCFYQVNTFKAAQTTYYGKSKQFGEKGANRNYPINYGRAKELAVGSEYSTYLFAPEKLYIPQWIRLGKWMAKVHLTKYPIPKTAMQAKTGAYACPHPLNPLDLPSQQQIMLYNRIVMPPVSLITQSQLVGEHWELSGEDWDSFRGNLPELPKKVCLPRGIIYGAGVAADVG